MPKKLLNLIVLMLIPLLSASQAYDRNELQSWMQQGNWEKIIAMARQVPEPDSFLLQAAGYSAYQAGERSAAADYYSRPSKSHF